MRILLRNTRTTDSLRPGGVGEFLARWCRACAACALLRNTRTTDSLRPGGVGEFLARWCRACAACALLRGTRTTDSLRPGGVGEFLARWCRACAACALLRNTRTTDSLRPGGVGEFLARWCRACAACALVLVLLAGWTAYGWDRGKAVAFLESRQAQWAAWKPAQKSGGACLSCHTGLSYLLAGRVLGEGEEGRKLEAGVRHRLRVTPVEVTLPDPGAEAVLNLFALAVFRKGAGDPVGEVEKAALADLWARQVWEGKEKGSWTWVNAALHPMDSELSHYWGTAVAERALAAFPAGPAERVEAMRAYLRREAGNQPLHHRLAWAAFGERSAGPGVLRDLWAAQGKDGGWTTVALGPWSAQEGAPSDRGSNAYATAWAAYAAREAGVSCSDKRLRRALDWLEARQEKGTGAWRAVSMNKVYPAGSIQEGFLTDAATGFAAAVLGACDTEKRERHQRSN